MKFKKIKIKLSSIIKKLSCVSISYSFLEKLYKLRTENQRLFWMIVHFIKQQTLKFALTLKVNYKKKLNGLQLSNVVDPKVKTA